MKALILSAGQGRRLLPMTAERPKCLLPLLGRPLIAWQIDELAKTGIDRVTVVVGYRADLMEEFLLERYGPDRVTLVHNAAFATSDNLVSCWMAREEMNEEFLLLNGDTLFESSVIALALDQPARPVTVMIDHKSRYDADDMKVSLKGARLVDIGKGLVPDNTDGESVGIILFRGDGPRLFRASLEEAVRNPSARGKWYLSVIREMCLTMPVWTCSLNGLPWCEVDYPGDLKDAEAVVRTCSSESREAAGCRQG